MRFLIDECLHESLVGVAHAAGFEALHANYLALSGKPDLELAERIVKDEFTFVTNNRTDFIRLFRKCAEENLILRSSR
jgi:predicted nuclease of predicted toxin-antitoxin system